jgi:ketosteroid isomerase-like protein
MESEESKDQARAIASRLLDGYNRKDVEGVVELYAPGFEYWSPLEGWRTGLAERRRHLERLYEALEDERLVARHVVTDGRKLILHVSSSGRSPVDRTPYEFPMVMVLEVEDWKIVRGRTYLDPNDVAALLSQEG